MALGDTPLLVDWILQRVATPAQKAAYTPVGDASTGELLFVKDADGNFIPFVGDGITVGGVAVKIDWANLLNKPNSMSALGIALLASDIPALDWSKITTGKPTTLAGYGITDAAAATHTHTTANVTGLDTALTAKAPLASPALTGTPTAPTATAGTNTTQLATTAFTQAAVQAVQSGMAWKAKVKVATTANITLTGAQTIDGIAVVAGDRVLVKNQTTGSGNGIYIVAATAWTRATDMDVAAEIQETVMVSVAQGTANADTLWQMITDGTITVGTTGLTWQQFTAGTSYTAGSGLALTGNQFALSVNALKAKPLPLA